MHSIDLMHMLLYLWNFLKIRYKYFERVEERLNMGASIKFWNFLLILILISLILPCCDVKTKSGKEWAIKILLNEVIKPDKLDLDFRGSELVCEVVNESVTTGWLKGLMNLRMHQQLHVGSGDIFLCGFKDGHEMEGWSPGIQLLDEWSYFDSSETKLGWMRTFGKIFSLQRIQWTTHYKLG